MLQLLEEELKPHLDAAKELIPNFSLADTHMFISLYQEHQLPLDLINYVIYFSASTDRKSMRYAFITALRWKDAGIIDLESAKKKFEQQRLYREIISAYGTDNSSVPPLAKKLINKWINEYEFDVEVIKEACKRTMKYAKNPTYYYTDSILSSWKSKEINSLQAIYDMDKKYYESSKVK